MLNVICVKWGDKYSSTYVNTLKKMCDRHITLPYQFHCLTDSPDGIDPNIKILELPKLPGIKTWWSKLYMFSPALPIEGTILYFDLDVVIFKNIDCLFTHDPDKFMIIRDFNRCRVPDWKTSNSSVMRWNKGTMQYLWGEFQNNPATVMQANHGDQDWITKRAKDDINHWPDEWIRSYKWEMIGYKETRIIKDKKYTFQKPPTITEENLVAVFHGKPDPHECDDAFVVDNWQ
jgi:hypothetical protein